MAAKFPSFSYGFSSWEDTLPYRHRLTARELAVVKGRAAGETLEEVGDKLHWDGAYRLNKFTSQNVGVTKEVVRQIEGKALRKMAAAREREKAKAPMGPLPPDVLERALAEMRRKAEGG